MVLLYMSVSADFNNLVHQLHLAYYDACKNKRNTQISWRLSLIMMLN
ncbi:hypothetical protein [uncultured Gammaproteobacteria bacterium]|jgi:hypothetical protein|nr:hypothetical protein [uncultured Gammaproteobacteria bacterium]CAC9570039.1 hypothetical protein [uncultured Gammaproteobacteria bacterium]CAC9605850.1 hypothetical protein [uncultured Gammaproteobacteria bacterium]CAC9977646.1 hypothetical protein [uncultured Gammaproteobacteria bacterium]